MRLKKIMAKVLSCVPIRVSMKVETAKNILTQFQPAPMGTCYTDNEIDIKKDLHIIIPAYNSERYINACLESVLCQKTDYKVLATVINDGSTDRTIEIINKKIGVHGNIEIEVISQENRGFSGARNTGLKRIKGRYVMFLDSDDILPKQAIQKLLIAADEYHADIVQGSWYDFCEIRGIYKENIIESTGKLTEDKRVIKGVPWGKVYKANVLKNFQFPEGYWFEDTPISFILAALPFQKVSISDLVYGYRLNPEGITATAVGKAKSVDSFWITEACLKEFPKFCVQYDQHAYEYLLRQSVMNARRNFKQPMKVRKAMFVLTGELMECYFETFKTECGNMKKIEKAIRWRQFIKFEMLVRGI